MLTNLYIENIAVIERAEVAFQPGLNVLTGETGAGKSILIDAISAVMGARMPRDLVRTGASCAFVSAAFCRLSEEALLFLEENGYAAEPDGSLLVQREIKPEGRAVCRINGRPAAVSVLRDLAPFLIAIQGQHESYELLSSERHIAYIDAVGENKALLAAYRAAYQRLRAAGAALDESEMDEEQKRRMVDMLTYQINELEAAHLKPGEWESLCTRKEVIQHNEKLVKAVAAAKQGVAGEEGALFSVGDAADALEQAAPFHPEIEQLGGKLREISYQLEDCKMQLHALEADLEYDETELNEIEARLDLFYRLSLKYGKTEEEMFAFLAAAREKLQTIVQADETRTRLAQDFEEAKGKAVALAKKLSVRRAEIIQEFEQRVMETLRFLDMPHVVFRAVQARCPLNLYGCDQIQFMISVNPGEEIRPIAKIASGGELSRIMLAIKTVLAGRGDTDTLIFDEVDAGISGSAAQKVGMKLKETSKGTQVICVTHLAQIAALADTQFLIQKDVVAERTYTRVEKLDLEGRIREVARIMSGTSVTDLMRKSAKEMILAGAQL